MKHEFVDDLATLQMLGDNALQRRIVDTVYQTPSGYTTRIGPCRLHANMQWVRVRLTRSAGRASIFSPSAAKLAVDSTPSSVQRGPVHIST